MGPKNISLEDSTLHLISTFTNKERKVMNEKLLNLYVYLHTRNLILVSLTTKSEFMFPF